MEGIAQRKSTKEEASKELTWSCTIFDSTDAMNPAASESIMP
jgi:hypothetical protein